MVFSSKKNLPVSILSSDFELKYKEYSPLIIGPIEDLMGSFTVTSN